MISDRVAGTLEALSSSMGMKSVWNGLEPVVPDDRRTIYRRLKTCYNQYVVIEIIDHI